jgi:AraC family transcriptional regulator
MLAAARDTPLGRNCYLSDMTIAVRNLFSGKGWRADDVVCTAGPKDRPFEERHRDFCIAVVAEGTFRYRSRQGTAMLSPGALLLGNQGTCFECGHEHSVGDRCISFHYEPDFLERVLSGVPGAKRLAFERSELPPSLKLAPLAAAAEAARESADPIAFEEVAVGLAGVAASALAGSEQPPTVSSADEKRVSRAVRRIEASANAPLSLGALAEEANLSPYHFLRSFRRVAGMTPYQYLLKTRLHHAALRLRTSNDPVSSIAYDAGFGDLSTFNRRFRRVMGASPSAYRRGMVPAG